MTDTTVPQGNDRNPGATVYVAGHEPAVILQPDQDGAIVRELDDRSEGWQPWSNLTTTVTVPQGNDRLATAMAEVKRLDPLDLLALYYLIQNAVPTAEFPRLIVVDEIVEDYSETRDRGQVTTYRRRGLRCPHCDELIPADDLGYTEGLIAVDMAERWTDGAIVSFTDHDVQWTYEESGEFEGLLYKHVCNQPVRLPDGWEER